MKGPLRDDGLCRVMPWRTVKSRLLDANPAVPILLCPAAHRFTRLYLCFTDEDKEKHSFSPSFTSNAPSLTVPQSLQAKLAGLISQCDLTARLE